MQDHRIFVSYSRKDAAIVTPLVQMLRLGGSGVFRDIDHIPPGVKWRAVLIEAVDSCELLVLFWCCHSSTSAEVEKEYTQAVKAGKLLTPVLLDETPLNAALAEYQVINMRGLFGRHVEYRLEDETERRSSFITPNPPRDFFSLIRPQRRREVVLQPSQLAFEAASKQLVAAIAAQLGVAAAPEKLEGE